MEFDSAPSTTLTNVERERIGFMASFGKPTIGGYVRVFGEDFRAAPLLRTEFGGFGFGGGVQGAPVVGSAGATEFLIPFRFGVDFGAAVEDVNYSGTEYTDEWVYVESQLEAGVGARIFGVQPSAGILIDNFVGLFESDNPLSPANVDPAIITGINVGGFAEVLFKPDAVPLTARVRAVFGDVSGLFLTFGFAF